MREYIYILGIISIIFYMIIRLNMSSMDREKISIYECGFQEFDPPKEKYFIKYYLIALIFLIFDLETLFIFPISTFITNVPLYIYILYFYILFIIIIGLAYEIKKGIIE